MFAAAGCFAVGLCIGWCGVAGFLLPILFVNACGLSVRESLFLSFLCFAVSGAIGSANYYRRGEIPLRPSMLLSAASAVGAGIGAAMGGKIPAETAKVILNLVVLASGAAILLREFHPEAKGKQTILKAGKLMVLGLLTAVICALSGAGGPVLVMPLLVAMGVPARTAVGMALLDSVVIALPAIWIYGSGCAVGSFAAVLTAGVSAHAVGVFLGSRTAAAVPQTMLKRGVAVFSVCFALFMLLK